MAAKREATIVRGLARGLKVLRALNERNHATAQDLTRMTGLPRPTVYRLLETLIREGYVSHGGRSDTFHLTIGVRGLADGFDDDAWVKEVAGPILADLVTRIVWPTDIATFDRDAMVVRETTHAASPMSINREKAGFRVGILASAIGKAYFSHCSEKEREMILRAVAASGRPDAALARNTAAVNRMVRETRARGYAVRLGGISPKTGSIAVPVLVGERSVAAINLHYILSALTLDEVVKRYLDPLHDAAGRIGRQLQKRGDALPQALSE